MQRERIQMRKDMRKYCKGRRGEGEKSVRGRREDNQRQKCIENETRMRGEGEKFSRKKR